MKKLFVFALLILISMENFAQSKITVDKIPASVEDFIALRDKLASTPEGGATAIIVATIMYIQNPTLGRQAMIIQSDKNLLEASDKAGSYKGFNFTSSMNFQIGQLDQKKYIPGSYVKGTSNANGYALPNAPYVFEFSTNQFSKGEDGTMKVFIACSGADTPRPVTLLKNDKGVWKAKEFSSLFVGVRAPVKASGPSNGDF